MSSPQELADQGRGSHRRLLIVDDDVELCELVSEYLTPEGFTIEAVHSGPDAISRTAKEVFSLLILDVMLPGMQGFEVLPRIRASSRVPVIMLTARGEQMDRILGLEIGADDYLPKPFHPRELAARIQAILRRSAPRVENGSATSSPGRLQIGDLDFDPGARSLRKGSQTVELTSVEFDLLGALLRQAGTVVSRDDLAHVVLGRQLAPFDRSVDVHISKLRRKLGPQTNGSERIKTVRGSGYVYALPG